MAAQHASLCLTPLLHCGLLPQASLASLRAEWSAELVALKTDVEHKRRMAAAALKARQEEEDIKVLWTWSRSDINILH